MASIEKKSFDSPDETTHPNEVQKVEMVTVGDLNIYKVTVEPGWQWSKHLKPSVNTESCEMHHFIYVISGKLTARMDDGKEEKFGPGDVGVIPPGHDGWNAGDEPAIWLEIPH